MTFHVRKAKGTGKRVPEHQKPPRGDLAEWLKAHKRRKSDR